MSNRRHNVKKRAFGNSDDHECDGNDEDLNECNALLIRRPWGIICPELDEEPDHQGREEQQTSGTSQLGNQLG